MSFEVQSKMVRPCESSVTVGAFEGLDASVFPVVSGELI